MDDLKVIKKEIVSMKQDFDNITDAVEIIEKNHRDNVKKIEELKRIIEKFYEHTAKKNDSLK